MHDTEPKGTPVAIGGRRVVRLLALALLPLIQPVAAQAQDDPPAIVPNDNRVAAGLDADAVREIHLEIRPGRWFPDGPGRPSEVVLAFAEGDGPPRIPGPLIRVRPETRLRVRVTNRSDRDQLVRGLVPHPADPDSALLVSAGGEQTVEFEAGAPGTYHYHAKSTRAVLTRSEEQTLHGAFIVDPADAPAEPADRVFVMTVWNRLAAGATGPPAGDMMAINGLSWPHTERFTFQVGDTMRWRWLNPTGDAHPMHLHGFYYDVTSRGTWAADTAYGAADRRTVVTELMLANSTMTMEFVPVTAGNWLFHCHFGFHVSHLLEFDAPEEPPDLGAHDAAHGMRGLILGIAVEDPGAADPPFPADARTIRLHALEGAGDYVGGPSYAFAVQPPGAPEPEFERLPPMGPTLVLTRNEPVRIEVVNRMRAPTAVHWHGLELERSYPDGVPGWSGRGDVVAPAAPPGGTFVAEFTPPRAGTFIYHSHSNELLQISSGLYGALIVEDPAAPFDPEREPVIVVGGHGWELFDKAGRVNGFTEPAPIPMAAGESHRLRIVNINPDYRAWIRLKRADALLEWRAVAKDGFDVPAHQSTTRPAEIEMGPGETADFFFTPEGAGSLVVEIAASTGDWSLVQPIEVR